MIKLNEDSQSNVFSTISLALSELLRLMKNDISGLNTLFSATSLDYEDVMKIYRDTTLKNENPKSTPYPLFVFNRTPLRPNETLNEKLNRQKVIRDNESDSTLKDVLFYTMGHIDCEFVYFARSIEDLERFEVAYHTYTGLPSIRELSIEIPDLGSLEYKVIWGRELETLNMQRSPNSYLSVSGKFTIEGLFAVFEGSAKVILSIQSNIDSVYKDINQLLSQDTIIG